MSSLVLSILEKAKAFSPDSPGPNDEVGEDEVVLGTLPDELKQLVLLKSSLENQIEESMGAVRAQLTDSNVSEDTKRRIAAAQCQFVEEATLVTACFWASAGYYFADKLLDFPGRPRLEVRRNWLVVALSDEESQPIMIGIGVLRREPRRPPEGFGPSGAKGGTMH